MKIVIDANILFSACLSANSHYRDVLFNEAYIWYSPNFVFLEIFKHKEKLLKCTKESEEAVHEFLGKILQKVHFVNEQMVSSEHYRKAYSICNETDESDTPFIALALEIDGYFLTGDKKLKNALKQHGFDNFFQV